jgi:hypothetical protein
MTRLQKNKIKIITDYPRVVINMEALPLAVWQSAMISTHEFDHALQNYCAARRPFGEALIITGKEWMQRHAPLGFYKGFTVIPTNCHVMALVPKYDGNGYPILIQLPDNTEPLSTVRYN